MSRIGKDERRFCVRDAFSLFAFATTLLLFVMFIFMLKSIGIRTATSPQHATSIISALLVPSSRCVTGSRCRISQRAVARALARHLSARRLDCFVAALLAMLISSPSPSL